MDNGWNRFVASSASLHLFFFKMNDYSYLNPKVKLFMMAGFIWLPEIILKKTFVHSYFFYF